MNRHDLRRIASISGISAASLVAAIAQAEGAPPRDLIYPERPNLILPDNALTREECGLLQKLAIIPGMGFVPAFGGGEGIGSYADWVAAVPNKTLMLRADQSSASNGSTTAWLDEVSGTNYNLRNGATWVTGSQNGLRGVGCPQPDADVRSAAGHYLWDQIGQNLGHTVWIVFRANATTYINSSGSESSGPQLISDENGFLGWNARRNANYLQFYTGDNTSGFVFSRGITTNLVSINTAVVVALRINDAGTSIRSNINGVAVTDTVSAVPPPSSTTRVTRAFLGNNNTNMIGYELILSSDVVSDAIQDAGVTFLKSKWGIT